MSKHKIAEEIVLFLIVAVLAVVLEICAFNFKPITVKLGWRQDETRVYTVKDLAADAFAGCVLDENGDIVLTAPEASFMLAGLDYELNVIRAEFSSQNVASLTALCDSDKEDKTVTLQSSKKNSYVDGHIFSVRFDVQGQAGDRIAGLTVTVNDYQFSFSVSRVIAMIAVVFITRGLFALQRPIDYGLDVNAKKEEEEGEKSEAKV